MDTPPAGAFQAGGSIIAKPTIKDVARLAGVSVGSVSRVINAAPRLRPETERRVLAAIAELGYHPSKVARTLRLGATGDEPTGRDAGRPLLVSVGSLSFDSFVLLDALPTPGERRETRGVQFFIGGPGAIVAVSARRLGPPFEIAVEFCTVVGDDRESDEAVERLLTAGVGASGILRDPAGHLPRCIVLVEPSGRRTILGTRSTQFPPGLRLRIDRLIGRTRDTVIHIEGHYLETCLPVARDLAAAGRTLTMDTTGLPEARGRARDLAELTHVFRLVFVSRTQARRIAGGLADADLPAALAAELAGHGWSRDCMVVLHLGPEGGALLHPGGRIDRSVGVPVTPVDVTGAGDVFVGVFLAAWMSGATPVEALGHATVAADLSTETLGVNEADVRAARLREAADRARAAMPGQPSIPGVTISG